MTVNKFIPMSSQFLTTKKLPLETYTDLLVFDIDNTLYDQELNILSFVQNKIFDKINTENEKRPEILRRLKGEYGFATKGMYEEGMVDQATYLNIVHGIDYKSYFLPDPELRTLLKGIDTKKVCFTNAEYYHGKRTLEELEVLDCFDFVICVDHSIPNFICKPMNKSFDFIEKIFQVRNRIIFFDDGLDNIEKARERGWKGHHIVHYEELKEHIRKMGRASYYKK